jgi:hypothetical protein
LPETSGAVSSGKGPVPELPDALTGPPTPLPIASTPSRWKETVPVGSTPLRLACAGATVAVNMTGDPNRALVGVAVTVVVVGAATTVTELEAVSPVPPWVELTADVVFCFTPRVIAVTLTENVQLAPPATVPPPG